MSTKDWKNRRTSSWRAIFLLLRLRLLQNKNIVAQGQGKRGVLGVLGILMFVFFLLFMISELIAKVLRLSFAEQETVLILLHLVIVIFFFASEFSFKAKNVGATEKDTVWLMTLPISMSTISLMKIARISVFNMAGTFFLLPMMGIIAFQALGWKAVFPALLFVYVPLVLALSTLVYFVDLLLGLLLKPGLRKLCAFFFSTVLFFSYFALYFIYFGVDNEGAFKRILELGPYLSYISWVPILKGPMLPLLYKTDPAMSYSSSVWFLLHCFCIVLMSAALINFFTRRGFREKSESQDRGAQLGKAFKWGGLVGKEFLLLLRVKRLWFSLLLPIFMIVVNQILQGIELTTTKDVIVQGFFVGLWMPLSAIPILAVKERESMWINFTLPQTLTQQFFRKMLVWAVMAALVSLLTIVVYLIIFQIPFALLHKIALVPLLIWCISSVFYGLRLSNLSYRSHLDSQHIDKSALGTVYLLVGSGYMAIYNDDAVQSFVMLFLFLCLAMAIWQKNAHRFPHLLDEEFKPRLEMALEHGVTAVIGFFVLQVLIGMLLVYFETTTFPLFIAFGASGFVVYALSAFYFWYNKATNKAQVFAFKGPKSWSLAAKTHQRDTHTAAVCPVFSGNPAAAHWVQPPKK